MRASARLSATAITIAALSALAACRTRPTQVTIAVESNVDPARRAKLSVIARSGRPTYQELVAARLRAGPAADEGVTVPGSLTIVPKQGEPRSGTVTLLATLSVEASATQPAFEIERVQRLSLIEGVPQQARPFFNAQCSDRALGCTAVAPEQCTVSRRCIEQSATCGDDGQCVAVELPTVVVPPEFSMDASVAIDARPAVVDASAGRGDPLACGPAQSDPVTAFDLSVRTDNVCDVQRGLLRCWGNGERGAIGDGARTDRERPTLIGETLPRWLSVAVSAGAACAIDASRGVWCWGRNANAELGQGDTMDRGTPTIVRDLCDVRTIAAGYENFCAITDTGRLYCWGANHEGQLGQDDPFDSADIGRPVEVLPSGGWNEVALGQGHTCAIRDGGALYCWGRNLGAQLGLGSNNPGQIRAPARVGVASDWRGLTMGQDDACALRGNTGELHCWGAASPLFGAAPRVSPGLVATMGAVEAGSVETFTLLVHTRAGELWSLGRNDEGQLGLGTTTSASMLTRANFTAPIRRLAAGRFNSCLMTEDDALWCTGENADGQLGLGDRARRSSFTRLAP
jgi:alpha-tubulin suppressor-like RCC1 family protein